MKFREEWKTIPTSNDERREEVVNEIETKISFMKELFLDTEKKAEELDQDDFKKWADNKIEELLSLSSVDAERFKDLLSVQDDKNKTIQKLEDLDIEMRVIVGELVNRGVIVKDDVKDLADFEAINLLDVYNEKLSEEERNKINHLEKEENVALNENEEYHNVISGLRNKYPGVKFIEEVKTFLETMVLKKTQTNDFREIFTTDKKSFFTSIEEYSQGYIEADLYKEYTDNPEDFKIEFQGVHLTITVADRLWVKPVRVYGFHRPKTPVSFIVKTAPESTIKHEKNHNLYESVASHQAIYGSDIIPRLQRNMQRFINLKKHNAPQVILDSEKELLVKGIDKCLNNLYAEILADTDSLFEGEIRGFWNHFIDAKRQMVKFINGIKDPEVDGYMRESFTKLDTECNAFIDKLSRLLFISKKTQTEEELRMCLLLFPNDLRKAGRYLEEKVGKEKSFALAAIYEVIETDDKLSMVDDLSSSERLFQGIFGNYMDMGPSFRANIRRFFDPEKLDRFSSISEEEYLSLLNEKERESLKGSLKQIEVDPGLFFYTILPSKIFAWDIAALDKYINNVKHVFGLTGNMDIFENTTKMINEIFLYEKAKLAMKDDNPDEIIKLSEYNLSVTSSNETPGNKLFWDVVLDLLKMKDFPPKTKEAYDRLLN